MPAPLADTEQPVGKTCLFAGLASHVCRSLQLTGADTIILHDVASHENFYRDLKQ